jgi:hypothetical protein
MNKSQMVFAQPTSAAADQRQRRRALTAADKG